MVQRPTTVTLQLVEVWFVTINLWKFHFWLYVASFGACYIIMIELLVICKGLMIGFDQCFRAIDVKFDPKVVVKLILDGCNVRHP
jgi:hypothetical protein